MATPEDAFDALLGHVLRIGVVIAALVVIAGAALQIYRAEEKYVDFRTFHGEPAALTSVKGIVDSSRHLDPAGVTQLGLLLLILTPVARVVFAVLGFAYQRDWLYVAISIVVLALLLYSLRSG